MTSPECLFPFEIFVESMNLSKISNVSKLKLISQNKVDPYKDNLREEPKKISNKSHRVGNIQLSNYNRQFVLLYSDNYILNTNVKKFPIGVIICKKNDSKQRLGSYYIWLNKNSMNFINQIKQNDILSLVTYIHIFNIPNELLPKLMASTQLLKLEHFQNKITDQYSATVEIILDVLFYNDVSNPINQLMFCNIKTTYSREEMKKFIEHVCTNSFNNNEQNEKKCHEVITNTQYNQTESYVTIPIVVNFIKSDTNLLSFSQNKMYLEKFKSQLEIENHTPLKLVNYIFGDENISQNRVYWVGYMTVENKNETSSPSSNETLKCNDIKEDHTKCKLKYCDSKCLKKTEGGSFSIDIPEDASHLFSVEQCEKLDCNAKKGPEAPSGPDKRILLDTVNMTQPCCITTQKIEEVLGRMTTDLKFADDPYFCSCDCKFGFIKRTTYCTICGGYEIPGEEMAQKPNVVLPTPCPLYHKIIEKGKVYGTTASDGKKKDDASQKNSKKSLIKRSEPEKEHKRKQKKKQKKDERFKFNYGYIGIPPKIGHMHCNEMECSVAKQQGWMWDAENVPGIKFRPNWKPGAAHKHVVRLLKIAKDPAQASSKKRKREVIKKSNKRPLLVVHKKDGEYTVTMETMKVYPKQRQINQQPYEDKPLLTYTVGRTEEENKERQKKKERKQRRLERAQREFVQSSFKDVCKEICVKTCQQAFGILPDGEDSEYFCYSTHPDVTRTNDNLSCSCSEENTAVSSETDSDEWFVEFTPPVARYDPTYKPKKIQTGDNSAQYTYLDYRVKLLDRYGNQVPRFFIGPDGKQQCSDLGGFWGPNHKWLEINVDGFIAPDGRWAPHQFLGPNDEQIDSEEGKFQTARGDWLLIGVDGFIDCNGKWRYYSKTRREVSKLSSGFKKNNVAGDNKNNKFLDNRVFKTSWSCFGDASAPLLSKLGITGYGADKKLLMSTIKDLKAHGGQVTIPTATTVPHLSQSSKQKKDPMLYFVEKDKCRHRQPSDKGILAVDDLGNKTYFKIKGIKNRRPKDRLLSLKQRGFSLSSFHVPCLESFIGSEAMKQKLREKLFAQVPRCDVHIATQT